VGIYFKEGVPVGDHGKFRIDARARSNQRVVAIILYCEYDWAYLVQHILPYT